MHEYRQALLWLRQDDSDRDIARSRLMGRPKAAAFRALAQARGWLETDVALPTDAEIAAAVGSARRARSTISSAEPFREKVKRWDRDGISGVVIHAVLCREHGFTGSYSSVHRLLASKNEQDRLIVLNRVARSVVDSVRGQHLEYVFVRYPKPKEAKPVPLDSMNTTAWRNGRKRAADKWAERTGEPAPDGFRRVRVHDLKHTFGRRLRTARVSFEDRQDLLGHKSGRITTHYSAAELASLIAAAEKVCEDNSHKSPAITVLRRKAR
jgi:integrase